MDHDRAARVEADPVSTLRFSDAELVYRIIAHDRRGHDNRLFWAELRRRFPEAHDRRDLTALALGDPSSPCGSIDREYLKQRGWL